MREKFMQALIHRHTTSTCKIGKKNQTSLWQGFLLRITFAALQECIKFISLSSDYTKFTRLQLQKATPKRLLSSNQNFCIFSENIYSFSRETINCGTLQFWLVAILFEATKLTSFITGKYNKTSTKETSFVKTSHQTVSSNNCPWLVNKKWLGLTRYHNAVVSKNSE